MVQHCDYALPAKSLAMFTYTMLFPEQILQRHFTAWYNIVIERRLQLGKARAMQDWRLLLQAWNAWKAYVRAKRIKVEAAQAEMDIRDYHR